MTFAVHCCVCTQRVSSRTEQFQCRRQRTAINLQCSIGSSLIIWKHSKCCMWLTDTVQSDKHYLISNLSTAQWQQQNGLGWARHSFTTTETFINVVWIAQKNFFVQEYIPWHHILCKTHSLQRGATSPHNKEEALVTRGITQQWSAIWLSTNREAPIKLCLITTILITYGEIAGHNRLI